MNTQMTTQTSQQMPLQVQCALQEKQIDKVRFTKTNDPLLQCAAAFLRRVSN